MWATIRFELNYSFVGDTRASLDKVTADLGRSWIFLETLYRIYSISGYNIAHVDVTAELCAKHNILPADIERIEAVVNWLETQYPSPGFSGAQREDQIHKAGSTSYHIAYAAVKRGFPMLRDWAPQSASVDDPPEALELMKRVTIMPSHTMTLFGPRITIFTKDGRQYTMQGTGREFIWDFDEAGAPHPRRRAGPADSAAQFDEIIQTCRELDREQRADTLVKLMQRTAAT